MRKPFIAANWKMNKTIGEALEFIKEFEISLKEIDTSLVDIVIAPPFTALQALKENIKSDISLSAQNMFWEDKGAYTGEISPLMLRDVGCKHVIIGHSERRQYFAETDESINKKLKKALFHGLSPIFCVGETLEQRERGETFDVVRNQIEKGLDGLGEGAMYNIIIAYEPVWAIGTGKTATPQQAEEVHGAIRALLRETYGKDLSTQAKIIYGGSVTPSNIGDLIRCNNIDGALVGGASLKVDSFSGIIREVINYIKEAE